MKTNKPDDFDGEVCIRVLLDKSEDPGVRIDAADSLLWYPMSKTYDAMLAVICDDSEDSDLREETAECLGDLWARADCKAQDLAIIPEPFKSALVREMELVKNAEQNDADGV